MRLRFFILALIGVALGCELGDANTETSKDMLQQLCSLKKSAPAVYKISETASMEHLLNFGRWWLRVECDANVTKAIMSLRRIVKFKNVCSQESADAIINFWETYVKNKAKLRKHLPQQLKKFFIAYGMQVSKVCKTAMIEQLDKATNERDVTETDFNLVTEDVRKRINYYIGDDWRLMNLLLVVQREKSSKKQNDEIATVNMDPLRQELYTRIRERCLKKFKPVYHDLITPIVRLAAVGFNYNGKSMKKQMKAFESEKNYRDWFAAVVSCEIVLRIDVVTIPKQVEESDGTIKQITVLDEDDLKELESKGLAREEGELELAPPYLVKASVDNLVLDNSDADLTYSMRKYKSFLSEVNKFHIRMMKKAAKSARNIIDPRLIKWGLHSNEMTANGELTDKSKFKHALKLLVRILLAAGVIMGTLIVGFAFTTGVGEALLLTFGFSVFLLMMGYIVRDELKSGGSS